MNSPFRVAATATIVAASVVLVSCAASETEPQAAPSSAAGTTVSVDNCGFDLELTSAPQRIVTIKSSSTEMLLALGLGDHIIGEAFSDGPVPHQWADAAAEIPEISDKVPAQEAVLALEPDFVYAGWESNLTADGAGDRAALAELGVGSYVSPSACKEAGYKPDPMTFELLFDEITEAGRVFGAEEAAADLVAEQRSTLEAITPSTAGLSALWYSSGSDTPYVGAGSGAPQMMLDAAGLTNVAGDVDDTWTSLSWEAIVDANPDVIVLVDATWNTAAQKIALLKSNPATASLPAVSEDRFITVPFAASEAGVRSVDTVASLVDQLGALDE
jgi:iron complex transport system substrate-binding protein